MNKGAPTAKSSNLKSLKKGLNLEIQPFKQKKSAITDLKKKILEKFQFLRTFWVNIVILPKVEKKSKNTVCLRSFFRTR